MLYAVHNITKIEKNHMYISSIYLYTWIYLKKYFFAKAQNFYNEIF